MASEKPLCLKGEKDLPELVVSLGSMLWHRTGSWRYLRPEYREKPAPCGHACPAGNDVEKFLRLASEGDFDGAWRTILAASPLPGVCGRVCFHPCEKACNRGRYDRPMAIQAIERFLADQASVRGLAIEAPPIGSSPDRVAIIGSGPAGLSCAYHLRLAGIKPVVFEAEGALGGVLRHGIPAYRLPKDVLDREIAMLAAIGIEFQTGRRVGKDVPWEAMGEYPAVFAAAGAHRGRRLGIAGEDGGGVLGGLEFLRQVALGLRPDIGKRVCVIGGGNTAIDAARTALRLGAQVTMVYRRSKAEMPAHPEEVEEAEREGVEIRFLLAPAGVAREGDGIVVEFQRMALGDPGADGRRTIVPAGGRNVFIRFDSILVAAGEDADFSFLPPAVRAEKGQVVVDEWGRTSEPRVFAGGDMAMSSRTVAHAIGSGRRAAMAIARALAAGGPAEPATEAAETAEAPPGGVEPVPFEAVNTAYFEHAERCRMPVLSMAERLKGFAEINLGISADAARAELKRCFHCGRCTACDNCLIFCPDMSVRRRPDGKYEIDYDFCKGCGVCGQECPRGVVEMKLDKERRQ
ncbi:MAG: NAD(P)-binding protein [Planctomycetota bacterium]|nr:NAD(P)-binding protein [Planctomycetota bacterium]